VGWDNSVHCLSTAFQYFRTEDAQLFLSHCFDKIVGILLDQQ
jgi:hypothetical protein